MCLFDDETLIFDFFIGLFFKWPGYGVLRGLQLLRGDSSERRPGTLASVLVGLAMWGLLAFAVWQIFF